MTHSKAIARWATSELEKKYERGQEEHGGNIRNKNVLAHVTEEALDLVVYLAVIQEQFSLIEQYANLGLMYDGAHHKDEYLEAIFNLAVFGNEKGEEEEEEQLPETQTFDEYYKKQIAERILENG